MPSINEYWEALERLKNNTPIRCPKGTAINNDTVALEAGRKRGSIKKSRATFEKLIDVINEVADSTKSNNKEKLLRERAKKNDYRERYHASLNRELMLINRLAQLEKSLERYANVLPISKGD